jgi:hypothetical protein
MGRVEVNPIFVYYQAIRVFGNDTLVSRYVFSINDEFKIASLKIEKLQLEIILLFFVEEKSKKVVVL